MDGESAYEIAVTNGFRGSEADYLASLKGDKGDPGPAWGVPVENASAIGDVIGRAIGGHVEATAETIAKKLISGLKKGEKGDKGDKGDSVNIKDVEPLVQMAVAGIRAPKIEVGGGKPVKDGLPGDVYINQKTGDMYQWS